MAKTKVKVNKSALIREIIARGVTMPLEIQKELKTLYGIEVATNVISTLKYAMQAAKAKRAKEPKKAVPRIEKAKLTIAAAQKLSPEPVAAGLIASVKQYEEIKDFLMRNGGPAAVLSVVSGVVGYGVDLIVEVAQYVVQTTSQCDEGKAAK